MNALSQHLKLHLGCGPRILDGWHHRDIADFEHLDSRGPLDDLSDFDDGSVGQIYASHVLEYYDQYQVPIVLREWRRVLVAGGQINIAVPDFRALVRVYQGDSDLGIPSKQIASIIGPLFGRMEVDSGFIYHRSVWDVSALTNVLYKAGFSEIVQYDPVVFLNELSPNFDDHSLAFLPHFNRKGIQISLCLQARCL